MVREKKLWFVTYLRRDDGETSYEGTSRKECWSRDANMNEFNMKIRPGFFKSHYLNVFEKFLDLNLYSS